MLKKKAGGTLLRLIEAGLIAMVLLSLFALAYDNSGIKETNPTGATATHWKGRQLVSNMTEGFAWFVTDENGFNNAAVPEQIDVLLTGDSHMEGAEMPQEKNVAAVLSRLLDGQTVYNIGIKGNFLNFAVQNAGNALRAFRPRRAVVLDVSDNTLYLELEDMRAIIAGEKERVPASFESGPIYYLKLIPCVKPLLYGIRNWIAFPDYGRTPRPELTEEYLDTLDAFVGVLAHAAGEAGVQPIILFQPNEYITPDGAVTYDRDEEYYDAFRAACEKNGVLLLDLTEDFRALTESEHIVMHGFTNTTAGSGHLNENGHRAMAEALARVLAEAEGEA